MSDLKKKEKKVSPLWEAAMKGASENRKQEGFGASEEAGKTPSISSAFNLHLSAILMRLIKIYNKGVCLLSLLGCSAPVLHGMNK